MSAKLKVTFLIRADDVELPNLSSAIGFWNYTQGFENIEKEYVQPGINLQHSVSVEVGAEVRTLLESSSVKILANYVDEAGNVKFLHQFVSTDVEIHPGSGCLTDVDTANIKLTIDEEHFYLAEELTEDDSDDDSDEDDEDEDGDEDDDSGE